MGGKNTTKCCTTDSPWKSPSTPLQELKEKKNSKHRILTIIAEGLQQPLNQRPDSCSSDNRMQTIAWRALGKDPRIIQGIPRSQQIRQREGLQFEGNKENDYCRQLRQRRQRGTKRIGRRALGILSILQALTIGEIFLRVRTGFGCMENNLQTTNRVCEQYTHKKSTYTVAQHYHISSREHAWLKKCKAQDFTSLCP